MTTLSLRTIGAAIGAALIWILCFAGIADAQARDDRAFAALQDQTMVALSKFTVQNPKNCEQYCAIDAANMINRAKRGDAINGVISSLQTGVRNAASATGVGGATLQAAYTGYDVIRCGYDKGGVDTAAFWQCVTGLAAGKALDAVKEKLNIDTDALKAFQDKIAGDVKAYKAQADFTYNKTLSGSCKTAKVDFLWKPRPIAGARGGVMQATVVAQGCKCGTFENYTMSAMIPVVLSRGPNGEAAWKIDQARAYTRLSGKCCGGNARAFDRIYRLYGKRLLRIPDFSTPVDSPKKPDPKRPETSEPEKKEEKTAEEAAFEKLERESGFKVCEECQKAYGDKNEAEAAAQDAENEEANARDDYGRAIADREKLDRTVRELEEALERERRAARGREYSNASETDDATITVDQFINADGDIINRMTTRPRDGGDAVTKETNRGPVSKRAAELAKRLKKAKAEQRAKDEGVEEASRRVREAEADRKAAQDAAKKASSAFWECYDRFCLN